MLAPTRAFDSLMFRFTDFIIPDIPRKYNSVIVKYCAQRPPAEASEQPVGRVQPGLAHLLESGDKLGLVLAVGNAVPFVGAG